MATTSRLSPLFVGLLLLPFTWQAHAQGTATPVEDFDPSRFPGYVMDDVVVPVPSEVFAVLDKLGEPNWRQEMRAVKSAPSGDRPMLSFQFGNIVAEGFIAVQAEVIALKRKAAAWGANEDEETISAFIGRWEALANWFQSAVFYEGERYPSVEHAFQAAKAGADAVAAKAIREAATPKLAHELGRKLPLPVDWERRKRPLMQALLRDKFRRDSALHERLLRTDNRNLIAGNDWGETFWGVSGGRGANAHVVRDGARQDERVRVVAVRNGPRGVVVREAPPPLGARARGGAHGGRPQVR
jgi:ribA/ribD-fused uncharacterized protein